mgnify:CR=1 FL=1
MNVWNNLINIISLRREDRISNFDNLEKVTTKMSVENCLSGDNKLTNL